MYERVKKLYEQGKLTLDGLKAAITKGWITEAQYREIAGIQEEAAEEATEETTEAATEEATEETAETEAEETAEEVAVETAEEEETAESEA